MTTIASWFQGPDAWGAVVLCLLYLTWWALLELADRRRARKARERTRRLHEAACARGDHAEIVLETFEGKVLSLQCLRCGAARVLGMVQPSRWCHEREGHHL